VDFTDTQLTADTIYTYSVQAFNGSVGSGIAEPVTVTTLSAGAASIDFGGRGTGTAPNTPYALVARATTPTTVVLQFIDNSTDETRFVIERSMGGVDSFAVLAATGPFVGIGARTFTDDTASPGTTYFYRLRAINGPFSSGETPSNGATTPTTAAGSNPVGAIPGTGTHPNGAYALVATVVSPTAVSLTFHDNATDETGFELARHTEPGNSLAPIAFLPALPGVGVGSFIDDTVPAGTTVYYLLTSFNGSLYGFGAFSNDVTTPTA
jgi:titin